MWAHLIAGEAGKPSIVAVRVAFGNIPNNTPLIVYVWSHNPATGFPALVIESANGLVANAGFNTFNDYPITPVPIAVGEQLFVGVIINNYAGGLEPARIDLDGTDAGTLLPFPPGNHSYIAGHTAAGGAIIDPNNLVVGLSIPVALVSSFGPDGNWLVRARVPITGACCDTSPTGCSVVIPTMCLSPNVYIGNGTTCLGDANANGIDDACEAIEACCFANGTCADLSTVDCANQGGIAQGLASVCRGDFDGNGIDDECESLEACCFPNGTCFDVGTGDCAQSGGLAQGPGTVCLGDLNGDGIDDACPATPSGACCEPNGVCTLVTQAVCTLVVGTTWNGAGTQCLGDANGNGIDDACEDCPPDFGWDLAASMGPSARFSHAMAYDAPNQRVVMFGGGSPADDETWEWDGSAWTQQFPAVAPSARFEHTMANHGGTNVIILFGGQDTSGTLGDTWMFNGNNWVQVFPANTPPARRAHAMSYDSARDVIVMFGGIDSNTVFLNDTWEWNGINWVERFPGTVPSPRFVHAMNYDSIRSMTVLYGGSAALDETWEWDGSNWTQRFPTNNPGDRNGHAQVFDAGLGVTLLFGGNLGVNSDLWAYDGNDWTQVGSNAPNRRSRPTMTYDAARRRTVLFGGTVNSVPDGETWVFPAASTSRAFQVLGPSTGTGWSWCIDEPVPGFSVCDLNVPGVAAGGAAADLVNRFVDTINSSGCPSVRAVANGSVFTVTIGGNQGFDFCVGPFGQQPGCCLPPSTLCPFNPDTEEVVLSGVDCDGNGVDDAIDLATDTLDDLDGNGIPDECESGIPTVSQWGLAAMVLLLLIGGTAVIKARKMPMTGLDRGG